MILHILLYSTLFNNVNVNGIENDRIFTDYNYFDLALKKCDVNSDWSIHGLWPEYDSQHWPQFCKPTKLNHKEISKIEDSLNKYWYSCDNNIGNNWSFWNHEYSKHGTCTGFNQTQYFVVTIQLFKWVQRNGIINKVCGKDNDLNFPNDQCYGINAYNDWNNQCLIHFNLNMTLRI
tara:strand:- start:2753 stop:3280 length:528 start_codon:yes stop_codon:yes gene_type:complete